MVHSGFDPIEDERMRQCRTQLDACRLLASSRRIIIDHGGTKSSMRHSPRDHCDVRNTPTPGVINVSATSVASAQMTSARLSRFACATSAVTGSTSTATTPRPARANPCSRSRCRSKCRSRGESRPQEPVCVVVSDFRPRWRALHRRGTGDRGGGIVPVVRACVDRDRDGSPTPRRGRHAG